MKVAAIRRLGAEMLEQAGQRGLDAVFVSVGGGGLISGVAAVLTQRLPGVRVYGASPSADAAMAASVQAGRVELCRELVEPGAERQVSPV